MRVRCRLKTGCKISIKYVSIRFVHTRLSKTYKNIHKFGTFENVFYTNTVSIFYAGGQEISSLKTFVKIPTENKYEIRLDEGSRSLF